MNKTAFDQYEEIVTDALKSCSAKLRKSFKTAFIQLMILYMVLPRKINFTQMGRYSDNSEQRFRQLFEREFDWIQFNLFLMRQRFGESVRKAIAIDANHISKSGKKTPYIGKFWSGCASAMKRGLEILGIGIVDIDSSFYILFFFPSIIVFPYSDKTFIYRIIYIIMCMLLLFVIWRYYSVQDLIVSFSGGAFALVGSSVLASLLKKISK